MWRHDPSWGIVEIEESDPNPVEGRMGNIFRYHALIFSIYLEQELIPDGQTIQDCQLEMELETEN